MTGGRHSTKINLTPMVKINYLLKNRDKFDKILDDFLRKNDKAVVMTGILSIILLSLFYSNIYLNFDFFLNVVLYLPMFVLNNLIFIVNIFLLKFNMMFLTSLINLTLPISEVFFLFTVSKFLSSILMKK